MTEESCAYANPEPEIIASYKVSPEDFKVFEEISFTPDGAGEHLLLLIEKTGLTTQEAQKRLSDFFQRPAVDVSFSGMKDKQAVTQQWFSIRLPGNTDNTAADIDALNSDLLSVLEVKRNSRKLKRGSHRQNRFQIRLRELSGNPEYLLDRLETIAVQGVPNYFGAQRFGRDKYNLERARRMLAGELKVKQHYQRGLYYSAARAWLFNRVLSERVQLGNWNQFLAGDVMQLDGTDASFKAQADDPEINQRLESMDIHPTGPLWGSSKSGSQGQTAELELRVAAAEKSLCAGLEAAGLNSQRRALRSPVRDLQHHIVDSETLELEFTLNKGAYATVVLRELVKLRALASEQANEQDSSGQDSVAAEEEGTAGYDQAGHEASNQKDLEKIAF
tara:strand:+ start:60302 stop:61471 length:1170 start_codon:yes stop_codon:yes gene_type:complete